MVELAIKWIDERGTKVKTQPAWLLMLEKGDLTANWKWGPTLAPLLAPPNPP